MLRAGLLNFSKGVLAEELLARTDVAAYNAGLKQGENIIVLRQGGFTIRPGFRVVAPCRGEDERLFDFQFSDEQPYALAFGQEYMEPMTAGGAVLEEELNIKGATNANPMELTADNHGFSAGDRVFVDGVGGDLGGYLNGRIWEVVASTGTNTFTIDLDGTSLPAFTTSTGGIDRASPPPAPPPVPPTPPPYVAPDPPPVYSGGGGGWYVGDREFQGQIP